MLNSFHISAIAAFLINLGLGVAIFAMNPGRRANRYFLISALGLAAWLSCFALVPIVATKEQVLFLMRQSGTTSGILPLLFDLLRDAIVNEKEDRRKLLRGMIPWCFMIAITTMISNHPSFVTGVDETRLGFPMPIYGPTQYVFIAVYVASAGLLVWRFVRDLRGAKGITREELGFSVLAAATMILLGLALAQVIPDLTGNRQVMQFLPLCVVMYDVVLAYGIVTRRIMSVSEVLRRGTAYLLIAVYLVAIYAIIYWPIAILASDVGARSDTIAHMVAALAVAFSIAPAHGRVQRVANRLFINFYDMDTQEVIRKAQSIMTSLGTMDQLLDRFAAFVRAETGTDRAIALLKRDGYYVQQFPLNEPNPVMLDMADGLVQLLREEGRPVSRDSLKRARPTVDRMKAEATLTRFKSAIAVGISVNERMDGVMLLATRVSGRIYGVNELDALQIICNQLGTSIENSRLYTALQDGKIYNDILVDSLVSGVIAVNADRRVTVFNHQAHILTGLDATSVLNQGTDALPRAVRAAIDRTLATKESIRDKDEMLGSDGDEIPVRLSSSVFHGHSGGVLGALVLLSDMRTVRQMEAQIRRSDRLSSIGTLAAGMAHEIKNPLVPIKTFTQLLPDQYHDPEFRKTFSEIVLGEVGRIDSIVTRLLHFARPAPAALAPTTLTDVLNNALKLLEQKIRSQGILMEKRYNATRDRIMGDNDLLSQAFVNFFLNAIEAMDEGGTLTVTTSLIETQGRRYLPGAPTARHLIRVDIADTGKGIKPEDLSHIFDPFFTTKSEGTGLGLAVSHGIIEEHGATIEVESHPPHGTTFHLLFELIEDKD